jgi:hypothetical protein
MQRLKRWQKAAIGAALLFAALFALSFVFTAEYQICVPNEYTHAKECAQHYLGPFVLFWIVGQADAHNGLVTAFATISIAVFTIALTRISNRQAQIIKDTLVVGNGAFVFVPDVAYFWNTAPDDPAGDIFSYTFRPLWQNSGNTQTQNMITMVSYELRDDPLPLNFDFTATTTPPQPALVGPKSVIRGGSPRDFSVAEMEAIAAPKKFLYLWGWTRYQDVFPGTPPHLTRYCVQVAAGGDLRSRPKPGKDPGPIMQFAVYAPGNCADNECIMQGLG